MISKTAKIWQFFALLLIINGCATQPESIAVTEKTPADWDVRREELNRLRSWEIMGKIGVRQPDQSDSAVINRWQQIDSHFIINLSSPILGMGSTQLTGAPGRLQITNADGETTESDDPEALLLEHLGWQLPLQLLPFWVKGIPSPSHRDPVTFTTRGDPATFTENGWLVESGKYSPVGSYRLPGKVKLSFRGVKITLVINQWELQNF
jgi:outer membrane lipoprotein LolB